MVHRLEIHCLTAEYKPRLPSRTDRLHSEGDGAAHPIGSGTVRVDRRFRGKNRLGILHRRGAAHCFGANNVLRAGSLKGDFLPGKGIFFLDTLPA